MKPYCGTDSFIKDQRVELICTVTHLVGLPNLLWVVKHGRLDELNKRPCFNYITVISERCLWLFPPVPCRAQVHDFRHRWWRGLMDLNIHFLHQCLFAAALRLCPQQWSRGQMRFLIELAYNCVWRHLFSSPPPLPPSFSSSPHCSLLGK